MKVAVFIISRYSNFFHYCKIKDIQVHFMVKLILMKKQKLTKS